MSKANTIQEIETNKLYIVYSCGNVW